MAVLLAGCQWMSSGWDASGSADNTVDTQVGIGNVAGLHLDWRADPGTGQDAGVTPVATGNTLISVARFAAVAELDAYSANGTVLDFSDLNDWVAAEFLRLNPGSSAFSACLPRDLDRIPTPTKIVRPDYPAQIEQLSHGGHVTVEFYIDQTGRVRMPSASSETNEVLAALAIRAVEQWRFEPPVARGRPALVQIRQDFNFKPGAP